MNDTMKKIAKKAGFIFWQKESWKPKDGQIDWSCNYDKEFEKYSKLLIEETIKQYKPCD